MALSLIKTTCMLLSSRHTLTLHDSWSIHINRISLNHVTFQKSLSDRFDEIMSWMVQIKRVNSKLASAVYLLRRITLYIFK